MTIVKECEMIFGYIDYDYQYNNNPQDVRTLPTQYCTYLVTLMQIKNPLVL